jgi:hypothetical protein
MKRDVGFSIFKANQYKGHQIECTVTKIITKAQGQDWFLIQKMETGRAN